MELDQRLWTARLEDRCEAACHAAFWLKRIPAAVVLLALTGHLSRSLFHRVPTVSCLAQVNSDTFTFNAANHLSIPAYLICPQWECTIRTIHVHSHPTHQGFSVASLSSFMRCAHPSRKPIIRVRPCRPSTGMRPAEAHVQTHPSLQGTGSPPVGSAMAGLSGFSLVCLPAHVEVNHPNRSVTEEPTAMRKPRDSCDVTPRAQRSRV